MEARRAGSSAAQRTNVAKGDKQSSPVALAQNNDTHPLPDYLPVLGWLFVRPMQSNDAGRSLEKYANQISRRQVNQTRGNNQHPLY